jgi:hypothetical protein
MEEVKKSTQMLQKDDVFYFQIITEYTPGASPFKLV